MGKRKYTSTVWVIEDNERLARELLEMLQKAFKRHVMIRTAPSIGWASNMDGKAGVILIDLREWSFPSTTDALKALAQKHPRVKIGVLGDSAGLVQDYFPEAEPIGNNGMVEFVRRYCGGTEACKT